MDASEAQMMKIVGKASRAMVKECRRFLMFIESTANEKCCCRPREPLRPTCVRSRRSIASSVLLTVSTGTFDLLFQTDFPCSFFTVSFKQEPCGDRTLEISR